MLKMHVMSQETMTELIRIYRQWGFNIITFTRTIVEMEKAGRLVIINLHGGV